MNVGYSKAEVKELGLAELKEILREQAIKLSDEDGKPLSRTEARETVLHLITKGKLGLLRAVRGRQHQGGPKLPFRATSRDVAAYWLEEFLPWWEDEEGRSETELKRKTVVWDNASTHSPVGTSNDEQISIFHRLFREWGFKGVIFLPPRSPQFNPIELAFAFVKHYVAKDQVAS